MTNISLSNKEQSFYNIALGTTGAVVGYEAEPYIQRLLYKPIHKRNTKDFKAIIGGGFEPYVQKALKQNNLQDSLKVLNLNETTAPVIKQRLGLDNIPKLTFFQKIKRHIMRGSQDGLKNSFNRTLNGQNAFCLPTTGLVICNFDKFGAPVFHEIAHKLNSQSKNILVKTLSKIRNRLAKYGTVGVSLVAMLKDPKEKRKKPAKGLDKIDNFVKDNCGLCAFAMVLPRTIEEFIANNKGTEIAKKAGVKGDLLDKVKKAHKISKISYASAAVTAGLAVYLASKLRDFICSYKKDIA